MLNPNSAEHAQCKAARRQGGFSLVEMVIASAAMLIVVVYTLGTFTVHHQTSVVIEDVAEAQQNMRGVANLLERDIRNAGYMVPDAGSICAFDSTAQADVIFMSDTDAILPVDDLPANLQGADLGARVIGAYTPNGLEKVIAVDNVVIDGTPTYFANTPGSVVLDSDFRVNGGAIIVDAANPARGTGCGIVTGIIGNSVRVAILSEIGVPTPGAQDLRLLPAHVYQVDAVANPPILTRDGVLLAENVEDLQAAFFFDDDADGIVDPNEYDGSTGLNVYQSSNADVLTLREVRFNVIVQTASDDPRNRTDAGRGQFRENRTAASAAGNDGRHRRVYTSVVRLRNIDS